MADDNQSWMELKWIEPESRFLIKTAFRRNLDGMTDGARRAINWGVLVLDLLAIYILAQIF